MSTSSTSATFVDSPQNGDFEKLIALLEQLGNAQRTIDHLQSNLEIDYTTRVSAVRDHYADLQRTITETEAAIEVIGRRNPQWFADAKTIKTPFGAVKFTSSDVIAVASEEASIRLITAARKSDEYLRTKQELDLEALGTLDDAQLAKFGLVRTKKQNFKVETKVVDLGKAVKAAEKSNRAANKTAKEAQS